MIHHIKPKLATAAPPRLPPLLLAILAASSTIHCACASSACGSTGHSGSSRRLSHPCGTSSYTSTTSDLYDENSVRSGDGSDAYLEITLGTIAGLLTILGVLFFIDKEAFDVVTCKGSERLCRRVTMSSSTCEFPDIDVSDVAACNNGCVVGSRGVGGGGGGNDDVSVSTTPYEEYLTEETADYLAEKRREEEKRRRMLLQKFLPCLPMTTTSTKIYDVDKYAAGLREGDSLDIDGPATSNGDEDVAVIVTGGSLGRMRTGMKLFTMGAMDAIGSLTADAKATLCGPNGPCSAKKSRPTRDFPDVDAGCRDKYYVEGNSESDDWGEVKYAASSYESDHTTPW
jgi:hypothetical protein